MQPFAEDYDTPVRFPLRWWYPEFDAPLGRPKGPAEHRPDGLWQRQFDGGLVVVNGTLYDAELTLAANSEDISTHRLGTRFTLRLPLAAVSIW